MPLLPAPSIAGYLPAPKIKKHYPKVILSDGRKLFFIRHDDAINVWIRHPDGDSHWYSQPLHADTKPMHQLWRKRHAAKAA